MKCVVYLSLLCGVCILSGLEANARLIIYGPQDPVLEGEDVTLECLSDSDTDMANYTFQKYSKWMKSWVQLDVRKYLRCWYYSVNISREDGRLILQINDVSQWQSGPFRCVGTQNETDDNVASENITVPVIYMEGIYLQKENSWYSYFPEVLWAQEGSTVEVKCSASASQEPIYEWSQEDSDWILPSDTLVIRNVNEGSEGKYICQARHPDMYSLVKTRSFELRVMSRLPEEVRGTFTGLNLGDIILYMVIPGVMLTLLLFTFFIIVLRHRRRQLRKPQISLVDGEKRIPIYKGSLQSVSSTASDRQPLVM